MSEELIERYLLQEMVAYGWISWDRDDIYFYEGQHQDYAVEIRVLPLGPKSVRLQEEK